MTGSTRALMAGSSKWPAGHARRKFFEARSSSPAEASLILEMIRRLYEVEDRARPLDDAARCAVRQAEAVPILQRLRDELDRLSSRLLPKSAPAQAVTYASNQWQAPCRYTQDGRLTKKAAPPVILRDEKAPVLPLRDNPPIYKPPRRPFPQEPNGHDPP